MAMAFYYKDSGRTFLQPNSHNMKKSILPLLLMVSLFAQSQTALEIIKKADELTRGESSQGEMTIIIEEALENFELLRRVFIYIIVVI